MTSSELRSLAEGLEQMIDSDSLTSSALRQALHRMHEIADDVHELEQRPVPPGCRAIRNEGGTVLRPQLDYWTGRRT